MIKLLSLLALVSVALADPIAIPKRKAVPYQLSGSGSGSGDDVSVDELSEVECTKQFEELETRECHLINKVNCVDPVENQMIIYERKCIEVSSTHCQHIEESDEIEDQFAGEDDAPPPFLVRKGVTTKVVSRKSRQFHHPLVQPMMAYPYASPVMPMTYAHGNGAAANYAAQVVNAEQKRVVNHGNVLGKLQASRSHPTPECEDIITQHCVADPVIHNYVPETKICYATEGAECEDKTIEIPYVTCEAVEHDDGK